MGLPQRPDQYRGETPPALGAGSRSNVVRARVVIISGSGGAITGLFEYSGAPALGNPPVAYSAAPGVTKDPFGNALPWTSGGFVSVSGTTFAVLGVGGLQLSHAGDIANPSVGESAGAVLALASGQAGTALNECILTLNPSATVPFATLQSMLQMTDAASVPAASSGSVRVYADTGGFPAARPDSATSDTSVYALARLTTRLSATTITSTLPATLASAPVAAREYHFRVHAMFVDNGVGAAGSSTWSMVSPAFSSGACQLVGTANGPLVSVRFDNASGFATNMAAPVVTPGSGVRHDVVIEGDAVFTASGTLSVRAAINAAGAAQFVTAAGSTMELFPV